MNSNIVAILPARMASTRFPGKPMADILGIPMIGHVYYRVKMNKILSEVYVATCDKEIYEYIVSIGGKAVMTSDTHERASDRCAEAMLAIENNTGIKIDIMVLVQGDEPLTHPDMIDEAVKPMLEDETLLITNLTGEIDNINDFNSPNEVKVVMDNNGYALYFSREPIPSVKKYDNGIVPMFKQIPIIPFKREYLLEYNDTKPTPLEIVESVDMLRVLENGTKIKMLKTKFSVKAVDTPDDLERVISSMKEDKLFLKGY